MKKNCIGFTLLLILLFLSVGILGACEKSSSDEKQTTSAGTKTTMKATAQATVVQTTASTIKAVQTTPVSAGQAETTQAAAEAGVANQEAVEEESKDIGNIADGGYVMDVELSDTFIEEEIDLKGKTIKVAAWVASGLPLAANISTSAVPMFVQGLTELGLIKMLMPVKGSLPCQGACLNGTAELSHG